MLLFLKGIIIGIGKIIPGVSGAILAINFKVYDKAIDALCHFFDDWKGNLKFLSILFSSILLAIIFTSRLLLFLIENYKFLVLMFFGGLIIGGTYNFMIKVLSQKKNIYIVLGGFLLLVFICLFKIDYVYSLRYDYVDNIVFFGSGVIEILATIIPGISGTSLLMLLGIYEMVLELIGNIFNTSYVLVNFNLYFWYGLGMMVSLIVNLYLVNYIIKRHHNTAEALILGFSLASIIYLLILAFNSLTSTTEFIEGIMLLVGGLVIGCILNK